MKLLANIRKNMSSGLAMQHADDYLKGTAKQTYLQNPVTTSSGLKAADNTRLQMTKAGRG